jgi:hypothetical protein
LLAASPGVGTLPVCGLQTIGWASPLGPRRVPVPRGEPWPVIVTGAPAAIAFAPQPGYFFLEVSK